nr:reverse transcriptase domain-containing protein [Tanacetum cinerariifolium]
EEAGIQLYAEEFNLMAATADLDEIEEVNANYILMANLQQALTSGTQTDKAPVYDSDESAEVHNYENCDDNEIFNMFTQEEQYTELLEPIPEPHQVPQMIIMLFMRGNFLDKMPSDCLSIIENKSKVHYSHDKTVAKVSTNTPTSGVSLDVAELKDMVRALLLDKKGQNQSLSLAKAVEESCVICGVNNNQRHTGYRPQIMSNQIRPPGFPLMANNQNVPWNNQNHFILNQNRGTNFNQGLVYQPPVFQQPAYQAPAYQAPALQTQGVSKEDFLAYVKANDAFINSNTASTSSSGTLPSNTIANPKSNLKAITTRSGVSYYGPSISPPVVKNAPDATKDIVIPTNNGTTEDVQPQEVLSKLVTSELANTPVSTSKPNPQALIPYPYRRNDERNREKAKDQIEKFYQIFKDMSFEISFSDALILMPKFASSLKALIGNKEKLSEMARTLLNEHCSAVLLKKLPEKLDFDADPRVLLILRRSFLKTRRALIDVFEGELTLRVGKEAITFNLDQTSRYSANYNDMTAKRIDVIDMAYEPTSSQFPQSYLDPEGDILLLEAFLKMIHHHPLRIKEIICEAKTKKYSVNEPPMVELKALPLHLEYAFLEGDDKLPIIIAKDLSVEEKAALITVLKSHKRAIAWKLSDIKGENRASWSDKLDDALWAFRTTYKTLIGCTPYKLVYGKAFHLPVEVEHKAYWALKHANFNLKTAGDHRKIQINELNELRDQAYENSLIYKEKTKKIHDSKIKKCVFNIGDRVLLFNSRLNIFSGKLKTAGLARLPFPKFFRTVPSSCHNPAVPTSKSMVIASNIILERTFLCW